MNMQGHKATLRARTCGLNHYSTVFELSEGFMSAADGGTEGGGEMRVSG